MGSPSQLVITLVRNVKGGSRLVGAITDASPSDGDYLQVEYHTDFQSDGGDFVIDPGLASEEVGAYTSLDLWNDRLLGIVRPNPQAHADGAIIQAGVVPFEEKLADGFVDGDMTQLALGIPVRSEVSTFLKPGAYVAGENAPVVWMWATDEDDDDLWIQTAPFGAKPTVGADLATMTPVGGGDSSGATTDPTTGKVLPPKGMGFEDGDAPTGTVVAEAFGGIKDTIHVNWTTIANSSVVNYDVHVSTLTGFTPGPGTLYSSHSFAGEPDFLATATIKDFPATHDLDGTASDPPVPGTDYFIVVIPRDGSGEGTPSTEVSATPVEVIADGSITSTKIEDGAISTPKLAANAVTAAKIAAGTITATQIAAGTITVDRLAAGTLSASNITAGTLSSVTLNALSGTFGTITAGTLTGVTIQTAASGARIVLSSTATDTLTFYSASAQGGFILGLASSLYLRGGISGASLALNGDGTTSLSSIASIAKLTGSIGTANDNLVAVSGSGDDTTINNNFSDLQAKINQILNALD